jgi:hypothetical protein
MEQFDFYFGLCLGEALLRHSDNLSEALQRSEMSAAQAQGIARMTIQTLECIRSDSAFELFWAKTCRNADVVGVSIKTSSASEETAATKTDQRSSS